MKIDDLLDLAEEYPLKGFSWGQAICDALNPYLSEESRLTLSMTGAQARAALRRIATASPSISGELSRIRIDPVTGQIRKEGNTGSEGPSLPEAGREYEVKYQRVPGDHYTQYERTQNSSTKPRQFLMLLIGVTLVIIALVMTFTLTSQTKDSQVPLESGLMETIINVLGDVFRYSSQDPNDLNDQDSSPRYSPTYRPDYQQPRYLDPAPSSDAPPNAGPRYD